MTRHILNSQLPGHYRIFFKYCKVIFLTRCVKCHQDILTYPFAYEVLAQSPGTMINHHAYAIIIWFAWEIYISYFHYRLISSISKPKIMNVSPEYLSVHYSLIIVCHLPNIDIYVLFQVSVATLFPSKFYNISALWKLYFPQPISLSWMRYWQRNLFLLSAESFTKSQSHVLRVPSFPIHL